MDEASEVREDLASEMTRRNERGVTLLEAMVSATVAIIGVSALSGVVFVATATNENQGKERTRAVIYAQDKMEKLLSLSFSSCTLAAASQPASCNTTGINSSGWTQGLLAGGQLGPALSVCPNAGPSIGYIDFLDTNGSQLTASGCSSLQAVPFYVRMWTVADLTPPSGGPALKQITVAVYAEGGVNVAGGKPIAVVTSTLSNPN